VASFLLDTKRFFFGARAAAIARSASLTPAVWFSVLPDLVWPTRPGTDHLHPVSSPWTTLYCLPRYSIRRSSSVLRCADWRTTEHVLILSDEISSDSRRISFVGARSSRRRLRRTALPAFQVARGWGRLPRQGGMLPDGLDRRHRKHRAGARRTCHEGSVQDRPRAGRCRRQMRCRARHQRPSEPSRRSFFLMTC
jgi:hypothetical protein